MNEEVLELNELQTQMVQQLEDGIKLQQHQLNAGIAMAMAGANLTDVNVLRIGDGKIFYNKRVVSPDEISENSPARDMKPAV